MQNLHKYDLRFYLNKEFNMPLMNADSQIDETNSFKLDQFYEIFKLIFNKFNKNQDHFDFKLHFGLGFWVKATKRAENSSST